MTLIATFNTATQALLAQGHTLSTIGTNIANVNTTAYKKQVTHFQTLLNHVKVGDKRFFTVDTVDTRDVDRQGLLQPTGRTYDLALNGKGFFVTNTLQNGAGTWQYTRDGSFFGRPVVLDTDSNGDGINDQGSLFVTGGGAFVMGWQADDDGNIVEDDNLTSLVPVQFNSNAIYPSEQTTRIALQANISAEATGRQTVGLPFVDVAGNTRTLTIGFTANLDNSFSLDARSFAPDNTEVPVDIQPSDIIFSSTGSILDPSDGQFSVTVFDVDGPQDMVLDLSRATSFKGQGNVTVQNIDHDGLVEGRLANTYFNEDGVLIGSFSNGGLKNLFKLPIATFAAPNNLEARSGNFFLQTQESGALQLQGLDSVTGLAQVVVGSLESSNVDLADQFTRMIVTQRAYSSSATVLRTADEMTQQARDLKR